MFADQSTDKSHDWRHYTRRLSEIEPRARQDFPDFFVVAPPKTGTTWLAENLRRHPDVVIPAEKEVRYFSHRWRQRDLNWYRHQFARKLGQIAGDISPSYALLPSFAIRQIRLLRPDLKIIVLLRRPIRRAWSHLKHTFVYGESNFAFGADAEATRNAGTIADISHDVMIRNFTADYSLSCGDYESILRRWASHFPRKQIHIEFLENIASQPERAIARIVQFLGISATSTVTRSSELNEIVNHGITGEIPAEVYPILDSLYQERQRGLIQYLQREFGQSTPWHIRSSRNEDRSPCLLTNALGAPIKLHRSWFQLDLDIAQTAHSISRLIQFGPRRTKRARFLGDLQRIAAKYSWLHPNAHRTIALEDLRLIRELDRLDLPTAPEAGPPRLLGSVGDYNVVQWRSRYYAIHRSLGPLDVRVGARELRTRYSERDLVVGASLREAMLLVEPFHGRAPAQRPRVPAHV